MQLNLTGWLDSMLSEPQGSSALGILHHHTQVFMWMLGIRIQVLVLVWQALYSRNHLPNLEIKLHQNLLKKMETAFLGGAVLTEEGKIF